MRVAPAKIVGVVGALLAAQPLPARADDRAGLRACQAMVDHAARTTANESSKPEAAELRRCRQVIHEWTLRDARMSVDERGRPLR